MTKHARHAHCSFCRKSYTEVGPLVEGPGGVYICGECAGLTQEIMKQEKRRRRLGPARMEPVTGAEHICNELEPFFPGQDAAKQALAAAAYRHYAPLYEGEKGGLPRSEKNSIVLVGPTASSRFFLVRALAHVLGVPCAHGDAQAVWDPEASNKGIEHPLFKLLNASQFDIEAAQRGILYIDKLEYRAVQQALPAIMDGEKTGLPSRFEIRTDNILFIVGGTFSALEDAIARTGPPREQPISAADLIDNGLPQELIKRFASVIRLAPLEDDVLTEVLGWVNLAAMAGET